LRYHHCWWTRQIRCVPNAAESCFPQLNHYWIRLHLHCVIIDLENRSFSNYHIFYAGRASLAFGGVIWSMSHGKMSSARRPTRLNCVAPSGSVNRHEGSKSNIPCCALLARQMHATFASDSQMWRASGVNLAH
jgi:hypothetical protein